MKDVLHFEIRKQIYNTLLKNPGLNLSTLAKMLHMSVALADYHLHYMQENDLITVTKEGGYKRYYVKGKIGIEDKKTLSLLQQELPLNIVLFLLRYPLSKPREIRQYIEISPALLTYYLKKLLKYGVISESASGEKNQYVVVNEQQIMRLLISYKPNVLLQRFKDTWVVDIPLSSKVSKKKKKDRQD